MQAVDKEQLYEAISGFDFSGELREALPYGNGHINDTFLLVFAENDTKEEKIIFQRMNNSIFKDPIALMENIMGVTSHLREKIKEEGGDPDRETLNVIKSIKGDPYFIDSKGDFWRAYKFISGATSYDLVEDKEHFYQSALAFGHFQSLLSDFDADSLHETIKGFHDTRERFRVFKKVVEEDIMDRAKLVSEEIRFVLDREEIADYFAELLDKKELPLRVTHNDTKLNNIMIDNITGKGICVIDLDTVMPGLAMNDFGDSIRFGASTALEDEIDLDKVSCDMDLFELYTKGFIKGCAGRLTEKEIKLLPMGAKTMTYECGMRFLTDFLQGDTYFRTHRPNHNLDRCRTQFKLVKDMEEKWETMKQIVDKYS